MDKKIAGKRSMECKQNNFKGVYRTVRNKIKHRKKYKIGKPRKRTIQILPSGVGDFPILYSPRC